MALADGGHWIYAHRSGSGDLCLLLGAESSGTPPTTCMETHIILGGPARLNTHCPAVVFACHHEQRPGSIPIGLTGSWLWLCVLFPGRAGLHHEITDEKAQY